MIQQEVIDQLKWEPILNAAEIGVSVKDGVVTLYGIVDTYYKKIIAENAAKKIIGVKAVAEDIQVGISPAFRKTDSEIAEAVINALKWNTSVPEDRLKVKVEDGVVALDGEVNWDYQRSAARIAIENLAGVRRINNFITVKAGVTPDNVKQKIVSAFQRNACIDGGKISVDVIGNKVVLTGKVRSLTEKEDAERAAWFSPGIINVENKLELAEEEYAF